VFFEYDSQRFVPFSSSYCRRAKLFELIKICAAAEDAFYTDTETETETETEAESQTEWEVVVEEEEEEEAVEEAAQRVTAEPQFSSVSGQTTRW